MKLKSLFKKTTTKLSGPTPVTSPTSAGDFSPTHQAGAASVNNTPSRNQFSPGGISLDSLGRPQQERNLHRDYGNNEVSGLAKSRSDPAPFQSQAEEETRSASSESLDVLIRGESRSRTPIHQRRFAMNEVFLTPDIEIGSSASSGTVAQATPVSKYHPTKHMYYTPESYPDPNDKRHFLETKAILKDSEDTYDGRPSPQPSKIRVPLPDESIVVSAVPAKCTSSSDSDPRSTPDSRSGLSDRESWDRRSERSVESELSVACLQGRIQQMEETHHSTSEELQATLQELSDLQHQLSELHSSNDRLVMERSSLLESMKRLQQDVDELSGKADTLQNLLEEAEHLKAQDEQRYVKLLRARKDEQENLQRERDQLRCLVTEKEDRIDGLQGQIRALEVSLSSREIAESERVPRDEPCLCHASVELAGVSSSLETTRSQLDSSLDDLSLLRIHLEEVEEEARDEQNRLRAKISSLEDCLEETDTAKSTLTAQVNELHVALSEAEDSCRRLAEEKREAHGLIAEMRGQVAEAHARKEEAERLLAGERENWDAQTTEWRQFQRDLLTTVRVANDFKVDAQLELEHTTSENQGLRDRLLSMQAELDKLKAQMRRATSPQRIVRTPSMNDGTSRSLAPPDLVNHRPRPQLTRLDSRLSVKRLVESIEQTATKTVKSGDEASPTSPSTPSPVPAVRLPPSPSSSRAQTGVALRNEGRPREAQARPMSAAVFSSSGQIADRSNLRCSYTDAEAKSRTVSPSKGNHQLSLRLLAADTPVRSMSFSDIDRKDNALAGLAKNGGSRRNALLKWCQARTAGYADIDITNFSSSWADGLALCALLHTFIPEKIPYEKLKTCDPRTNIETAFAAAEEEGIPTLLSIDAMLSTERPDWQNVLGYITVIYQHFEEKNL